MFSRGIEHLRLFTNRGSSLRKATTASRGHLYYHNMSQRFQQYKVKLNNGVEVPLIGMGSASHDSQVIATAKDWMLSALLECGVRHIDTAGLYGTETAVGEAIKGSGIPREEIFVTTKLPFTHHGRVQESFEESLQALGLDYVDAYMLHWPAAGKYDPTNPFAHNPDGTFNLLSEPTFNEVWEQIEKLLETKKVRTIGVCNFSIKLLEKLLETAKVVPSMCQVELHPYLAENALRDYCSRKGIALVATTPSGYDVVRSDPLIVSLAEKYKITPNQVIIAWHVARRTILLPTSTKLERRKENLDIQSLSEEDLAKIWSLDRGQRVHFLPDAKGTIFGWTVEQLGWDNYPSKK